MSIVTSPNRAYLASAIAYAQISLQETSNTLGALSEIRFDGFKNIDPKLHEFERSNNFVELLSLSVSFLFNSFLFNK